MALRRNLPRRFNFSCFFKPEFSFRWGRPAGGAVTRGESPLRAQMRPTANANAKAILKVGGGAILGAREAACNVYRVRTEKFPGREQKILASPKKVQFFSNFHRFFTKFRLLFSYIAFSKYEWGLTIGV